MKRLIDRMLAFGLFLLGALGGAGPHAQTCAPDGDRFPSKPIHWIVPYPPGGPTDVVARIVGQSLSERLRQPVLIENRAGAFGNIGLEAAARAAPDGYTLAFGMTSMVLNPVLHRLDFDPLTDLTAVTQLVTVTYVLLASADFPPRTLPEVLAVAKAKPGTVTCGWGATVFQLGCELLKVQGQVDLNAIPYKGNAPAMNDLAGGQINLLFDSANTALPQVKSGRVRAIATANPKRGTGPFGGLPTVAETLRGFELTGWFGVLAPAATPRHIVDRLNCEIAAVLEEDELRARLNESGLEVVHGTPEAFAEVIRGDHARYSKMVTDLGIRAE